MKKGLFVLMAAILLICSLSVAANADERDRGWRDHHEQMQAERDRQWQEHDWEWREHDREWREHRDDRYWREEHRNLWIDWFQWHLENGNNEYND